MQIIWSKAIKLIPRILDTENSTAESRVFDALQHVTCAEYAVAIHSLNLREHQYKLLGELDFVLVGPAGLLVLEVKGGGVRVENGIWYFRDRYGQEHRKSEGPFKQAQTGMFALAEQLVENVPELRRVRPRMGYGVIFPDTDFQLNTIEWPKDVVLNKKAMQSPKGVEGYLGRVARYWGEKNRSSQPLSKTEQDAILRFLRPDFEFIQSLSSRADQLDSNFVRLTENQMEALDGLEGNKSFICEGGAGTGKTLLAVEMAKRHGTEGKRVALLCSNPILAKLLSLKVSKGIDVLSASELRDRKSCEFDGLVVDEAQDVINLEDLAEIDRVLDGGLDEGCWQMFMDRNLQIGLCGNYEEDAFAYVRRRAKSAFRLTRNCRNTDSIIAQTSFTTGADLGAPRSGFGVPVTELYYQNLAEGQDHLMRELKRLEGDGVPKGDITLLSDKPLEESIASEMPLARNGMLTVLNRENIAHFPSQYLTFSTVADFKGLENKFIILVDCKDLVSRPNAKAIIYTAMSRARIGLTLLMPQENLDLLTQWRSETLVLMNKERKI